ncbi:MAG: GNAT family N-acetyltransferase [Victivallales bacterium]|nr:GNAT family N-acetyltransferase [Victivallales bacterium]
MRIVEYFESDASTRQSLLRELRRCDWAAGGFLMRLLEEGMFAKTLGGEGKLFFLLDGNAVVSFLTLTAQDCIAAPGMTPWIGFVFTFPEYRGRHLIGTLLDHARKCAAQKGSLFVFLATDHVGLYEKYGFSYWGSRRDVYGEMSRVYYALAADISILA